MRFQIQETKFAWILIYLPFEILTLAQHRPVICENNSVLEMVIAWHACFIEDRDFVYCAHILLQSLQQKISGFYYRKI